MGVRWTKRPTDLDIGGYAARLAGAAHRVARVSAFAMEADAKLNAPWQDDTGAARAGLTGSVEPEAPQPGMRRIRIVLAHSVEYGQFLEFSRGGRNAILWPTIERELPNLARALQDIPR